MDYIRRRKKQILAFCLSLVIIVMMIPELGNTRLLYSTMAEQVAKITTGVTNVNVRKEPNTSSAILTTVNGGQTLTILDQPNNSWYHVTFKKSGTSYTGYVSASYVTISNEEDDSNTDFEAYLTSQGFPESYKPYLRSLHELHPEWKFVAFQTGLDWNTVISNEINKQGQIKNLVQGTAGAPHYNWRETSVGYNWATDTWSPYDGTTWFAASKALVEYYMDPRTYLYETYIFAFEQLSYDADIHNADGVEAIFNGSFMYNSVPNGESKKYSAILMEAADSYDVSPYHLASRMKQEMGTKPGVNATGTSTAYPGIFNFFNIGANDSAGGGAVNNGLAWAAKSGSYGRPWNSAYKAIMGGSQYVGTAYINRGQDTLYTQKFNVAYKESLYSHQYMSNIQAPATEAASMCRAYKANGIINSALVFKIPVYLNMPQSAVTKPADSGSPNNWLKSLAVSGYSVTPTFTGGTTEYSLIVDGGVNNITVSASTVNSKASLTGTGTIKLSTGTTKIPVTVTAQNGTVRTYTITVVRKDGGDSPSTEPTTENTTETSTESGTPVFGGTYKISNDKITGVAPGTDVASFVKNLGAAGCDVKVYKSDGKTMNDGTVGTSNIVKVSQGSQTYNYTVLIYGDVSGDGEITALDLLKVQKHLTGAGTLSGIYLEAANVKKSGNVSALDLLKLQKHIIGASSIQQ